MITLPHERSHDYFNLDDNIVVSFNDKWYFGKVKKGYRHHDGCVSYKLEGIGPREEDYDFEGFWGCGTAVPNILKIEEFEFFHDNPDAYVKWFEEAKEQSYGVEWEFSSISKEDLAQYAKYMLSV